SQAVLNVIGGERYGTVTQELKDYLQGLYGRPPVAADAEIRRLVLGREEPITIRPADLLQPQVPGARAELAKSGIEADDDRLLVQLLFPALAERRASPPPTEEDALESDSGGEPGAAAEEPAGAPGSEAVPVEAVPAGSAAAAAVPPATPVVTADFQVEVEGETYTVRVTGAGMSGSPGPVAPGGAPPARPKAREGSVVAPMQGLIVKVPVKPGDAVKLGDVVAVLEAMKMQNDILTTSAGRVQEVYVKEGEVVSPNQALVAID
ncbi:MAG: biotin/lipoyl-containing protein, partial [Candidatus Dormibacteraceae bacterium]